MIASPFNILDRIVSAVNAVHERLQKSVAAIENAGIAYALTDDNAVAAWVAQADESAVRNTPDVTLLIRRTDFNSAKRAMVHAGFEFYTDGIGNLFIDTPGSKRGTHLFFANELIDSKTSAMHPDLAESENVGSFRVLSIPAIARTKLATFRDRDRLNVRDLIDVGLIDQTWPARFPAVLAARLQLLLDTYGG